MLTVSPDLQAKGIESNCFSPEGKRESGLRSDLHDRDFSQQELIAWYVRTGTPTQESENHSSE